MLVEFIMGVSIFAHDVVILMVWMEDKHSTERENKILKLLSQRTTEILPQYITRQDRYPVGFVCTKAPFKLLTLWGSDINNKGLYF